MQDKSTKRADPAVSPDSASDELGHMRDEARDAIERVRSDLDAIEALLIAVRARQRRRNGPFPSFLPGRPPTRARNDVVLVLRTPVKERPRREFPDRKGR